MGRWSPYSNLETELKEQINKLVMKEFADTDFLKEFTPADPEYSFLEIIDGKLVAFIHAVDRDGYVDGNECKIGGLMNLVVLDQYRNQGIGKEMFKEGLRFLEDELNVDLYVGFPADQWLFSYYESLGCSTSCFTFRAQSNSGPVEGPYKTSFKLMNQNLKLSEISIIDLKGNPW